MKKIIITLIALTFLNTIIAQSPNSFNYQAVVRDAQGQILDNQSVSIKMSILKGSENGNSVFEETHNITSTKLGIINLQIGSGQNQIGSISNISWKNDNFWLKIEMDETGGSNYIEIATSKLISVPYAMHAETATYVDDADADPNNEIQSLSFNANNNELSISQGNTITIPTGGTDADADPTNEIQNISKSGNTVTLSKNGGSFVDEINDADADSSNELQNLSFNASNNELTISDGNTITIPTGGTDADADPTNELQNLNLTGNTLSISQGNQVDLSSLSSPWQNDGTGIKYEGSRVRIYDPTNLDESITIFPYVVNVNDKNAYQSYLGGSQLTFQNLQNTPELVAEYGYSGMEFFKPGNPIQSLTKFDKDSLYQYDPGVGLVLPSTTKMVPGHLTLDFGGVETARLSGFGLDITSKNTRDLSLDVNSGLRLYEYVTPSDRFLRMDLEPDSLTLFNSAKWKTVQLGIDPDFGNGMLKLFHEGGLGEFAHIAGYFDGGGFMNLMANGELKAQMNASFYGGSLTLFGMNNSLQYLATTDDLVGGGYMAINDTLSSPQIQLWATRDTNLILLAGEEPVSSSGHIFSSGEIYSPIVQAVTGDTIWSEMNNFGFVTEGEFAINTNRSLKNVDFTILSPSIDMMTSQYNDGNALIFGTNGYLNTAIFGLSGNYGANYGALRVYDGAGIARAGIEVDPDTGKGIIWADTKNFRIDHPTNPNKDIVYASLEGPEAAAYTRGTSQIENGKVFVQFPEHFKLIANSKTMTVTLTPLYSKTFGLAVVEKTDEGFWVEELMNGKGNFEFDWEVKCVRKGHENFEVIRDKINSKSISNQKSKIESKYMINKNKKHHPRPTNESYINNNHKK